jgi:hypothetical protein
MASGNAESGNLINNINKYVDNSNFFNEYDFDIWITFMAIVITLFIVIYFYFKANLKMMKNSWEANKCNPFYMPFGKEITKSNDELFNLKNAKQCSDNYLFSSLSTAFEPINAITSGFSYMFSLFSQLFINFLIFLNTLFNLIKEIFNYFMKIIVNFINICMSFILDVQEALYVAIGNIQGILYTLNTFFNALLCLISIVPVAFFTTAVLPNILIIIMAGILLGVGMIMCWFPFTAMVGSLLVKFSLFTILVSSIVGVILGIIHRKTIDFAEGAAGACFIAERESM